MLEGLYEIDWSKLEHAYGTAENIPTLVENLASDNARIRERAAADLFNFICHQLTVYEAAVAVIPFLIELLTIDTVQDKQEILAGLQFLSDGEYWAEYYTSPWSLPAREEVAEGLPVYISLLFHPEPEIRRGAISLLYSAPRYPAEAIPHIADALYHCIVAEPEIDVRAVAIVGLSCLFEQNEAILQQQRENIMFLIERFLSPEMDKLSRFAASLALPRLLKEDTPSEVVNTLIAAVARPDLDPKSLKEGKRVPQSVTLGLGLIDAEAIFSLQCIGLEHGVAAFTKALALAEGTFHVEYVAVSLLDWVFNGTRRTIGHFGRKGMSKDGTTRLVYPNAKETRPVKTLSSPQRQAVRAVLDEDRLWEVPNNLLEMYGLPPDREETRRLLEATL